MWKTTTMEFYELGLYLNSRYTFSPDFNYDFYSPYGEHIPLGGIFPPVRIFFVCHIIAQKIVDGTHGERSCTMRGVFCHANRGIFRPPKMSTITPVGRGNTSPGCLERGKNRKNAHFGPFRGGVPPYHPP